MHIVIGGCGRVGSELATSLSCEGHDVVIIDRDPESFKRLGATFNGITLEGIVFDDEVLVEAGIEEADAFAAVTNLDNANLMASEIASKLYHVPRVISRLYNPDKELTFFKMDIDYINGTVHTVERIRDVLFQREDVVVRQNRVDIGMQVIEFEVPPEAGGKPAGMLDYGISSKLVYILRGNHRIDREENTTLAPGDRLVVTMRKEGWSAIRECMGESACPADIIPAPPDTFFRISEEPEGAKIIIAGCSMVGAHLAYILSMEGHKITIIDENPALFDRLAPGCRADVIAGKVYDEATLVVAGIEDADAFAAVTKFDNTNLMATEVAKHVFNVPHVVGRLFNPDKERTYQSLGLNYVCGTRLVSRAIFERLLESSVVVRTSCLNNMYDLAEFDCPVGWDNKTVGFAEDRIRAPFVYVARRNTGYMPESGFKLRKGDTILVLATPGQSRKLQRVLQKYSKG